MHVVNLYAHMHMYTAQSEAQGTYAMLNKKQYDPHIQAVFLLILFVQ